MLLQEVDRNRASSRRTDQPGYYAQQLGMHMAFGINVLHQGNGEYGVATLSKYPIVETSNTHLPNDPSLPKTQQRGILNTQIKVGETLISVYNTHLQHIYEDLRIRQIHVIAGILADRPAAEDHGRRLQLRTPHTRPRRRLAPSSATRGLAGAGVGRAPPPRPPTRGHGSTTSCTPTRWSPSTPRVLLAGLRPPRRPEHVRAQQQGRTNLRARLRRTLGVVPPRVRSHESRRGTHPRGHTRVTN